MVIGNVSKRNDMTVNPTKGKELSNMRASGSDEAIKLTPPVRITLERGMSVMNDDEYLEITPNNIRLRKQFLSDIERIRQKRKENKAE
jgi:GTP-binding protein